MPRIIPQIWDEQKHKFVINWYDIWLFIGLPIVMIVEVILYAS